MHTCWMLRMKAILHIQHVRVGATKSHVSVTTSTCQEQEGDY